nr:DEAD/DEAH box helicase [Kibdelosporangium sp. MJ126-NF4]CEL19294.1 FIG003033: Helicase domain protein [Kibdelosporangium sp. MJ126-NF4]CTQ94907.1 FIG003033: Helicase domain protein [Kibdelosporangium sp. MJ126-NF4]
MSTADRLHPVVLHHVVNTLGWPELRPLQQAAINPVMDGDDCLLLAPTAGGKTEAAIFPVLSTMGNRDWRGLSVLYVTPLRALLNNLQPRLDSYASWLGRRAMLWHGDTADSVRRQILRDPPDILLITPESLEAMLVSTRVTPRELFANLQTVVVDEVHAFAGDDRGWHLLAVLERLQRLAGRAIQRVGLSATVGNPSELLAWLQGSGRGRRPAVVVNPPVLAGLASPEVVVDLVHSVDNAATVIAALHAGEKRLVFCDSRRRTEQLTSALRARGVTTFVSHSSLSAAERRRSEEAFVSERDCVIVATSTLELGIDIGDLDRVIQLDAPATVASFLQRIGRTGRRADTIRNCLFLALDEEALLKAYGLLHLWGKGWVEPVTAPPEPHHIAAQQLLALALQEGRVGSATWPQWWAGLPLMNRAAEIADHLVSEGFLHVEEGMYSIGAAAESSFGRRHFMELTSVFTSEPAFTLLHGRSEIGQTHPTNLFIKLPAGVPRVLLLAGRSWRVNYIDWRRHRCFVEPVAGGGTVRWQGQTQGLSFTVSRAVRDVLLGANSPVTLTKRGAKGLARVREDLAATADPEDMVVARRDGGPSWWTWAGDAVNTMLQAGLPGLIDPVQRQRYDRLRLLPGVTREQLTAALDKLRSLEEPPTPTPTVEALTELKFNEALPAELARSMLAARLSDNEGLRAVFNQRNHWTVDVSQ